MKKRALILGVTGQDGSYLAEFLLKKDYNVVGVRRRSSAGSLWRLQTSLNMTNFSLVESDVTDYSAVLNLLNEYKPDEIYNLAAQSHVGTSFSQPGYTWDVTAKGVLNILESLRFLKSRAKLYQASSSEMFGSNFSMIREFDQYEISCHYDRSNISFEELWGSNYCGSRQERLERVKYELATKDRMTELYEKPYQNEETPFNPQSPYAVAKLAAHQSVKLYREAYGIWACGGILFNHESPRRGLNFVTRKITSWLHNFGTQVEDYYRDGYLSYNKSLQLSFNDIGPLNLGNLDSSRDWGYAPDYVEAMWLMLQQESPKDYVIGTGETHTVKEFLQQAFKVRTPKWNEWLESVIIDDNLKRPAEVPYLRADSSLAEKELGWKPKVRFEELVEKMVKEENGQP